MKRLCAFAVLVLSASLLAQVPPQTAILRGVIFRLTDSQPIAGARITVLPPGAAGQRAMTAAARGRGAPAEFSATADGSGRFVVTNIPAGRYTFAVQSDGYFAPRNASGEYPAVASGEITIPAQGLEVRVGLIPGSTLAGVIRDSAGRNASRVTATLLRAIYVNGVPSFQQVATRETDDRGQFRLFRVPPGEYYLAAIPPLPTPRGEQNGGRRGQQAPVRGGTLPAPRELPYRTYFPGALDPRDATPIVLKGGEEINNFNFIMRSGSPAKLSGRVAAAGVANVYLVPRDRSIPEGPLPGLDIQISGADNESRFEINGVLPGSYDLLAVISDGIAPMGDAPRGRGDRGARGTAAGQRGRGGRGQGSGVSGTTLVGRVPVNVGAGNIDGLLITMQQAGEIRGRATVDGAPFNGYLQVSLVGDDYLGNLVGTPTVRGNSSAEAPLNLRVLPNVPYQFLVSFPPLPVLNTYIADIVLDGRSVFDRGFVAGSGLAANFEVQLKNGAATINGNVLGRDGKAFPGAVVTLAPTAERRQNLNLYKTATADATGRYELRNLAPGEYKIFAWDYLPDGAFQNSNTIARYEDRGVSVTVRPNDKLTGDLNLIER